MVERRLDILCITQNFFPDSLGGVERVAHEMMRGLAARGHRVDLVGQRARSGTADVEERDGITIHRYGTSEASRRFAGRTTLALRASRPVISGLLAARTYDVVLPHHFFPYYAYSRIAGRKSVPEILTFHASFWQELRLEGAERNIGKPLESFAFGGLAKRTEVAGLKRADRVIVLSDFSRDQLASYFPFAEPKVVKIHGGVDLERFRPARDRSVQRRALGLPEGRTILLTVRRLVPRMGLETLLDALAAARETHPRVLLVIAGRGRLEGELRARVASLGLQDHVRFAGFVADDDLVRYYQAADLFVLPTLAFEGFGMVTLEALACGTPAIGTPIGATPEILRPLAEQLVLDGTDAASIRRGIQVMVEWLSDPDAAKRLRSLARRYTAENFGWEPAVDALEDLIKSTLAGAAG